LDGKDTYTFTENGEFTFEFVDEAGNKGSMKASVNWIDKEAPTAIVSYSTTSLTNQDVVATIHLNEENAYITNNDGKNTYTFTKNGEFIFEFVDEAGNKGTAKASVNWIDKEAPKAIISYDITSLTSKDVTATIQFNKENVTITNNSGKNTYTFTKNGEFTFEFIDKVGNVGTATAKVDWIEKDKFAFRVVYDITSLTNKNVIATIQFNKENVTITNNSGKNTYTFTKNGEFTFEFVDEAGNRGSAKAIVNWINKTSSEPSAPIQPNEVTTPRVPSVISKPVITVRDDSNTPNVEKSEIYNIISPFSVIFISLHIFQLVLFFVIYLLERVKYYE